MKRSIIEILVVLGLIAAGVFSMVNLPSHQAHYVLDHQRINYTGRIFKNKFNGQGKLSFANHDQYVGNFKDGQFNGKGSFVSHKKWTYKGTFRAGLPHGKGTLTTADHHVYHGVFKKGALEHAN